MEILHNYNPYPVPRRALLYQTGNEYILDKETGLSGWTKIEKEAIIIGEDDTCYITELKEHTVCDTTEADYGETKLLPLGYHKSRLIRWLDIAAERSVGF